MIAAVQSVIKNISKVTLKKASKKLALYVSMLILSKDRKNYASMARENNLAYKKVYILNTEVNNYIEECIQFLHEIIKNNSTEENPGYIIVDFTLLEKHFSEHISGVTYDYDGSRKRVEKGFSTGFIVWSNGNIVIPFDYTLWLRKKDAGEFYKKKTTLVIELILAAKKHGIPFKEVRLDGAFASVEIFNFIKQEGLLITARIPSNRVIDSNGEENQLSKHSHLQMKGNEKYKTIQGSYKEHDLYFTAHKRNATGNKKEVVFIVSNVIRTPKEHVEAYSKRWPPEKYFRSSKQHIGITHCQSTNADKQKFHIFSAMVAYSILQCIKYDKKKQSVEEVVHDIRRRKDMSGISKYIDLEQTIMS
jgi:Transposase DDE domain